jgi:hypothetical protein
MVMLIDLGKPMGYIDAGIVREGGDMKKVSEKSLTFQFNRRES